LRGLGTALLRQLAASSGSGPSHYERFAETINRHREGIAACCKSRNKVSLGLEGLDNKIRVFQRRVYALKDEEYLRLKVLLHASDTVTLKITHSIS